MFGLATGVLGWTPDVARAARIEEIVLAYKAKVKWVRMCNGEDVRSPSERLVDVLRRIGK